MKVLPVVLLLLTLSGCGWSQSYQQYLDNRQRTFERQQAVLEAQNNLTIAKINVQVAQQQAAVNVAIATGKAQAQEIQTRSLKQIFIQQELVDAIAAGKVNTIILPSNSVLPLNLINGGSGPVVPPQ